MAVARLAERHGGRPGKMIGLVHYGLNKLPKEPTSQQDAIEVLGEFRVMVSGKGWDWYREAELTPRNITTMLWCAQKIEDRELGRWWEREIPEVVAKGILDLSTFNVFDLVNLSYTLVSCDSVPTSTIAIQRALETLRALDQSHLREELLKIPPHNLGLLLWATARRELWSGPALQFERFVAELIVDEVVEHFSSQNISNTLWSLARIPVEGAQLKYDVTWRDTVVEKLCERALSIIDTASSQHTSTMLWSLANLLPSKGPMARQLAEALSSRAHIALYKGIDVGLANGLWGCSVLAGNGVVSLAACHQAWSDTNRLVAKIAGFSSSCTGTLARALNAIGLCPPPANTVLWSATLDRAKALADEGKVKEAADMIKVVYFASHSSPVDASDVLESFAIDWVAEAPREVQRFTNQNLIRLAVGMAGVQADEIASLRLPPRKMHVSDNRF
ncbi:hypothetical protein FOL47_009515 [Perkinsus chesapeaki]|uniref:Uncharacterized protein n=1 Tax=Perkinsus chesapeaki TaxID=330153 RepID=A0A7J6MRN7_PERCH|nr:hypothetical protein FOL47_009515 [Perkinsus chesapeaki]